MPAFTRENHGELRVLVVSGEIDIYNRLQFADALHSLDASAPSVIVDFCKSTYFDSSALTELIRFRNERVGQKVMLAVPHLNGQRILRITGLDRAFTLAKCVHEDAELAGTG